MCCSGIAIRGVLGSGLPTSLAVDKQEEPDTREAAPPALLHGTVTISNLTKGEKYVLYRYRGTASLPVDGSVGKFEARMPFTAPGVKWVYKDPRPILSDTAVYFRTFRAEGPHSAATNVTAA